MEKAKQTYKTMRVAVRLNFRTECRISPETLAGVLETGTEVKVLDGYKIIADGHSWVKIKIDRKHYFICRKWLETVEQHD